MKHYKDSTGKIFGFESDGSQDHLITDDMVEMTPEEFESHRNPPISLEVKKMIISKAVQKHLDSTAKSYGYDNIQSAVSYADEPSVPKFQVEGQAFRAWRSLVWDSCYNLLSEFEAGNITEPTPDEVIAQLPSLSL